MPFIYEHDELKRLTYFKKKYTVAMFCIFIVSIFIASR